jgi:hypothetical protein
VLVLCRVKITSVFLSIQTRIAVRVVNSLNGPYTYAGAYGGCGCGSAVAPAAVVAPAVAMVVAIAVALTVAAGLGAVLAAYRYVSYNLKS